MTISYSGSFLRLLVRWKGSIWRSTWKELLVYIVLYYAVRMFYIFAIPWLDRDNDDRYFKRKFEALCGMFDQYTKLIPLTFLLGFYVSNVVSRWWRQFETLYWPEDILSLLCLVCPGSDERSQKRRHLVARYLNLAAALAWRDVSSRIRIRFPHVKSLVHAGLLTEKEFEMLEVMDQDSPNTRWMIPLHWIQHTVMAEVKDNSPQASLVNSFMQELKSVRQSFRRLFCYDWVCVPLPYTQVAALATYAFFFFCLFGRQFVERAREKDVSIDLHVPLFTIVQFLFFVGWFKIGQDLMRPFGMDDDDIEMNYIFERNLATSFAIVHKLQGMPPPAEDDTDMFWAAHLRGELPSLAHTPFSLVANNHPPKLHSYIQCNGADDESTDIPTDLGCRTRMKHKRFLHW